MAAAEEETEETAADSDTGVFASVGVFYACTVGPRSDRPTAAGCRRHGGTATPNTFDRGSGRERRHHLARWTAYAVAAGSAIGLPDIGMSVHSHPSACGRHIRAGDRDVRRAMQRMTAAAPARPVGDRCGC
jgi:hypothetical protein